MFVITMLGSVLLVIASSSGFSQMSGRQIGEQSLRYFDPYLIKLAQEAGLYSYTTLPVCREMNPFYIRGDFNGDGGIDIAFWVRNPDSDRKGVAILHSTLDTLFVFGAGHPNPAGGEVVGGDLWRLLPVGYVEPGTWSNIPEIGVVAGEPFTFEREALEFVWVGKSAQAYYWAKGRYWLIQTAD
jgi:hypothetical protein